MSARPVKKACPGCGVQVLHILDVDTQEPIVLDAERVDEGHISVYLAGEFAAARRYGRPARLQPAWREHDCPTPTVAVPRPVPVEDPYEDQPQAAQQHGGWRE